MLIRHAPDIELPEGYFEMNCRVCGLTFTRKSWIPGKGHRHPDDDALQKLFTRVLNQTGPYIRKRRLKRSR